MENESGKSTITLLIVTVLIMIGVVVLINYAQKMVEQTKLQDLETNMLLIQAEAKKGLEKVCFGTANLKETKEEDLKKINEVKQENLSGIIFSEVPEEIKNEIKKVPEFEFDDNCYYLDEAELEKMGIKEIDHNLYGYFIVKYDFEKVTVEVINTKGYEGRYTLTQLNELIEKN